jgi:hypothetical protein
MSKRATPLKKPEIILDQNAPAPLYRQLYERRRGHLLVNMPYPEEFYAPLREAIAAHIGITRGVQCSSEQIILTAGAQGAFDLVARVLLDLAIWPGWKIPAIRERVGHSWPLEQNWLRCQLTRRASMSRPGDSSVQRRGWPSSPPPISSPPESP